MGPRRGRRRRRRAARPAARHQAARLRRDRGKKGVSRHRRAGASPPMRGLSTLSDSSFSKARALCCASAAPSDAERSPRGRGRPRRQPTRAAPAPPTSCTLKLPPLAPCRDAAALACTCPAARAAYAHSKWPRKVRIGPSGAVFEPASGAFDVTVTPGEEMYDAVERCPPGGCMLLLPGTHAGPLKLGPRMVENGEWPPVWTADKEVHIFGRGRATLRAADDNVLSSRAVTATVDGLVLRRGRGLDGRSYACACIDGGGLRLQASDIQNSWGIAAAIDVHNGDPVFASCK